MPSSHLVLKTRSALSLASAGLVVSTGAAALVLGPPQSTYFFTGTCSDCTLDSPPAIGTLVLEGYTPGDAIQNLNFVSFAYDGSNLVDPYSVTRNDVAVRNPSLRNFGFDPTGGSDLAAGAVPAAGGAARFQLRFSDNLKFETALDGQWFTCAPKGAVFYSGSCNLVINNDHGSGGRSTSAVPEPGSYALMGLGLLGLAGLRRSLR